MPPFFLPPCPIFLFPLPHLQHSSRHFIIPHSCTPSPQSPRPPIPYSPSSAFNRAILPARRVVGRYELTRVGVATPLLPTRDQSLTTFSVIVATFTAPILLFPLLAPTVSVEAPLATLAAIGLTLWAVDTLALDGLLQRAYLVGTESRRRMACHEAGHLLVAYLLGVRISAYSLPSVGGVFKKAEAGVCMEEIEGGDSWVGAAVGLAGIAGEIVGVGGFRGGEEDMAMVGRMCKGREGVIRWGLLVAVELIRVHENGFEGAVEGMLGGSELEKVLGKIEEGVERGKLMDEGC